MILTDRDYATLFSYFLGAKGEHAVHVRVLIHAGFDVRPDPEDPTRKSLVFSPEDDAEPLGTIVGEPSTVIGRYKPEVKEKVIKLKEGSGY